MNRLLMFIMTLYLQMYCCSNSLASETSANVVNELKTSFNKYHEALNKVKFEVYELQNNLSADINSEERDKYKQSKDSLNKQIDSITSKIDSIAANVKSYLLLAENQIITINFDSIKSVFKPILDYLDKKNQTINNQNLQAYLYFGEHQIFSEGLLNSDKIEAKILKNVLLSKSELSNFGTLWIPKDNQTITIKTYSKKCLFQNACDASQPNGKCIHYTGKFKSIDVHIKDGYFHDIRAFIADDDGNIHVYNNSIGASLLFYDQLFKRHSILMYSYTIKSGESKNGNSKDNKYLNTVIHTQDVLNYTYKAGNRYIPHELNITLPKNDIQNKATNTLQIGKYEIYQTTELEKVVELRAYSDFLALFGEANNGLVQIEGKAQFYLFPYPFRFFGSKRTLGQIEYFPTITPYINYSRFEDEKKYVDVNKINTNLETPFTITNPLELIEKRFLTMGLHLDVLKWQHKSSPFVVTAYGVGNYNLSQALLSEDETETEPVTLRGSGVGLGIKATVKRFGNFGFEYKWEWLNFNYKSFNAINNLLLSDDYLRVYRHEIEVYYHPNGNPNNAIFLRMQAFQDISKSRNASFHQLQFGYKFAIGNRSININ